MVSLAQSSAQPPAQQWTLGDGPICLVGAPPLLSGILHFTSRSAEKLKIKTLPLRIVEKKARTAAPALELRVAVRLAPQASENVTAQLSVDEQLLPGTYAAEIDAGGKPREARLHVLERRSLAVLPSRFDLLMTPGSTSSRPVVLVNRGNVPFVLPKVVLVPLGQIGALTHLFHEALAEKGAEGHVATLDAYAGLMAAAEAETMKAVFKELGGRTLAPGETACGEIEFTAPAKLARHRSYTGNFTLGGTRCGVRLEVETSAATRGGKSAD